MNHHFHALKVHDSVYWVGAIDWNLRDFHGYSTNRGSTYNAFLVMADKITLIDTVKAPFINEMMSRISSIIDPREISYIVSNHAELDHSGCLPQVIDMVKPDKVFASVMGVKTLNRYFDLPFELTPVKDGDTFSLGNKTISFIETRMLHWPESMFSYLMEDALLFSSDAFGMHLAAHTLFADEIDKWILTYEGEKYFANILLPYAHLVLKLFDKLDQRGLTFSMILPDHGPVRRRSEDITAILGLYRKCAEQKPEKKALIVYDTMWRSTEEMADVIAEGIRETGVEVMLMSLKSNHRSDITKELLNAGSLVVGSPTMNNAMLPSVADFMTYIRGLRPKNLMGAAFGSYGWSGEAVKQLEEILGQMKVELVGESISALYRPDTEVLDLCFMRGKTIGELLQSR